MKKKKELVSVEVELKKGPQKLTVQEENFILMSEDEFQRILNKSLALERMVKKSSPRQLGHKSLHRRRVRQIF